MTESEWLECSNPQKMLNFLRGRASDRKLRLFAVACCRRIWNLLSDGRSRKAVELTEWQADQALGVEVMMATQRDAATASGLLEPSGPPINEPHGGAIWHASLAALHANYGGFATHAGTLSLQGWPGLSLAEDGARSAALDCCIAQGLQAKAGGKSLTGASDSEQREQAILLRDIFSNAFRPVTADPSWLSPTVLSLATAIYEERAFDRLPILADALEDAGCDNADILNHCRQPAEHARGCWAVDLVLGKK
jgi:hypothetical protein